MFLDCTPKILPIKLLHKHKHHNEYKEWSRMQRCNFQNFKNPFITLHHSVWFSCKKHLRTFFPVWKNPQIFANNSHKFELRSFMIDISLLLYIVIFRSQSSMKKVLWSKNFEISFSWIGLQFFGAHFCVDLLHYNKICTTKFEFKNRLETTERYKQIKYALFHTQK